MASEKWRIREWFPSLDERAQERLRIYHLELLRWTKKINLIGPSTADEADLVHFADAILGAQIVLKSLGPVKEIWDIGSGNGFPGVVFCILKPELGVLCLDSDERKISFLKQLSLRLELDNLAARCERIEKIPSGAVHHAVMRGFAPLAKALTQCQRQFPSGGTLFHFKGSDWVEEMAAVPAPMEQFWKTELIGEYKLDLAGGDKKPPQRAILKSVRV